MLCLLAAEEALHAVARAIVKRMLVCRVFVKDPSTEGKWFPVAIAMRSMLHRKKLKS